ncbi:MAG: energy transducer TonB [Cytophagales bacterium]|nr:energy transducer TonB [Cytophagales bacterium]
MKNKFLLLAFFLIALCFNINAQDNKKKNTDQSEKKEKLIPIAKYFEGGQDSLLAFIYEEMIYPMMAKKNRIQGECIVEISLDANGGIKSVRCLKNIGGGLGEEAVRIARLIEFSAPGYDYKGTIPVRFRL